MTKFINKDNFIFDSYSDFIANIDGKPFRTKDIIKYDVKLDLICNKKIVKQIYNTQSLYLYPLTLIDYVNNINNIINLNIINIDYDFDYVTYLDNYRFRHLLNIEILIKNDYKEEQYKKINEIINFLINRKVKVSLNIENLKAFRYNLLDNYDKCNYYKIFLSNIDIEPYVFNVLHSVNRNALIHVKSYLNENDINEYENIINILEKYNVDIFQLSKELIPLNVENVTLEKWVEQKIRYLERKYSGNRGIKFKSVKDLTCLYYPRFELDERNSRKCFACKMRPYLSNKLLLPCKVSNVLNNLDVMSASLDDFQKYDKLANVCGIICSDCASIFENDILTLIEEEINTNDIQEFVLEVGDL